MAEQDLAPWPSDDAIRLWLDFKQDPQGWHWTDLKKLLDAWGITDPLPDEEDREEGYYARVYRTKGGRKVYFWFRRYDECPAEVVLAMCDQLERLWKRKGEL